MAERPQSLNGLIATVFSRACDPVLLAPPPPPPSVLTSDISSATPAVPDPTLTTLSLLEQARRLSDSLSVISENDELRDISTSSLRVLFLPSLGGELELAVTTRLDYDERKRRIRSSIVYYLGFLSRVFKLHVLPAATTVMIRQQLSSHVVPLVSSIPSVSIDFLQSESFPSSNMIPPRELKIALFKLERALKQQLDQFRSAYANAKRFDSTVSSADPFYDVLLTSASGRRRTEKQDGGDEDEEEDGEEDEEEEEEERSASSSSSPHGSISNRRQYLLTLLNLHAVKASCAIQSCSQELELLTNMPPPAPAPASASATAAEFKDSTEWRLDSSLSRQDGPILDPSGKPLRPFTIVSSSSTPTNYNNPLDKRQQLRDQVFRSSHRLPTMSIDEFLEEENRRGNIIQGGGPEGAAKLTPREQRSLRSEQDGTLQSEIALEEARKETIQWELFTESNKRGAGNTMNRG